jgi:CheY-like chemotaxis protein
MKKKLSCILLIDDDNDCNFFHKKLLTEMKCTEFIEVALDGSEGIEYLLSCDHENKPIPDIIFLDINMPKMNGWDFLVAYGKLPDHLRAKIVVIMLTTSLNPDDRARALKLSVINGFREKYLDEKAINEVLKEHFVNNF